MNIKEFKVIVRTKKDLHRNEIITEQRNLINSSLKLSPKLLKLHEDKGERLPYIFSIIFNQGNIFEKGKIFEFAIRSQDSGLLAELGNNIIKFGKSKENRTSFEVITINNRNKALNYIKKVTTDTPILLLDPENKKRTLLCKNPQLVLSELNRTMVFKYNVLMGRDIPLDTEIFTGISVKKPVVKLNSSYKHKDFYKVGFTADLVCNLNRDAQEVLEFCMNVGVGSSCSFLGAGFLVDKEVI